MPGAASEEGSVGRDDFTRGEDDFITAPPDEEAVQKALEHQQDLDALASRRLRMGLVLTSAMLVVYFGFVLLVAFDKTGLSELITDGLSWAMLLGVLVILATWALIWFYVWWANRRYEPEIQRLKRG
jgi:uncharacterized membrane protein (DUF485 family)